MALSSKETIAKNTILLYIRTLIVLFVSLWTSRVILLSLGAEDFGIFNAVGGLVTMFAILTGSMSSAISRFITFEIGTGNLEKLKRVFSASIVVQVVFVAVIVFVAETIGLWFLNNKMVIPAERMAAANWVFQFTVITFCFNLLAIPYNAELIAHEHMKTYAYVSIVDNVLRLAIAFLIYVSPIDKLVFYSALMTLLAISVRLFYQFYCKHYFEECRHVKWRADKGLILELGKFAGWNMFGSAAVTFRTQGISILLNVFFGPLLNAAYGIANQVNAAVMMFTNNFTTAFTPSITKAYAEKEYSYMNSLVLQGARFSYYLLFIFVLPILFETETILSIWLKEVPDHAVQFVRLVLIFSLVEILSGTIVRAVLATGDIKKYQVIVGSVALSTIPIAYLVLKLGGFAETTMMVSIIVAVVTLIVRLLIVKPMIGLSFSTFIKEVMWPVTIATIISSVLPSIIFLVMPKGITSFFVVCLTSIICAAAACFLFGCTTSEKNVIMTKIKILIKR